MIKTKKDLLEYMLIDKRVLGISESQKRPSIWGDDLWRFLRVLRKLEYYTNNHDSFISRLKLSFYFKYHRILRIIYGFEIPPNCFDAGLKLNHLGPIIVNEKARIGKFCDIHIGVNIGQNYSPEEVPIIGDNVRIGPGVKIFGKITIADGIMIGANSVVNKSFTEPNITIAGIPAKKISNNGNPWIRK